MLRDERNKMEKKLRADPTQTERAFSRYGSLAESQLAGRVCVKRSVTEQWLSAPRRHPSAYHGRIRQRPKLSALLVDDNALSMSDKSPPSTALFPANGHQSRSDLLDTTFSGQKIELRCRITRVGNFEADTQVADVLSRLLRHGHNRRASAQDEQV